ncbi:hypothetical protein KDQ40_21650 (plasmid) [Haloarcula marismortui ATCC 33800]|uniref:Uncharacterized protein n=2 Tax=Haloarcula marismortui TaxID=2238 RepID=M0JAW4_9EURY|nr:hypothetical protein [Haloarcula sinaiiensis]EMA06116.1 hypothetical protein C436_21915 [Haloarcula sinaiiensis ATCC 33800]QUJ74879.1 hypothetical protein KDQ40_21650 [Haloarcula sinaiiensis ATCC 33800]
MPSNQQLARPQQVLTIANSYLKRERPATVLLPVAALLVVAGVFAVTSFVPAIVVGGFLTTGFLVPLIQPRGTVRLRTDTDVTSVVDSFTSPVPPILPLQWGTADEVVVEDGIPVYTLSYLFGLCSAEISLHRDSRSISDGSHRTNLQLRMDGTPWSRYAVDVYDQDGQAEIEYEYEYEADQRFGLRRLPQRLITDRYFEAALRAQGYTVVERNRSVTRYLKQLGCGG